MKIFLRVVGLLLVLYIVSCVVLYFSQESLLCFPEKLDKDFEFNFHQKFQELNFKTRDNLNINGILFHSDSSKGLIFYLHGNAGSLNTWEAVAKTYTYLNYDVLMLDYRGYGKSEGKINSETQLYQDLQIVYNDMKTRYDEKRIIVLGYSIGTGPATKIASVNQPKLLILQAPYFSLIDMMKQRFPFLPTFILKYKFETYKFIKDCKMPIVIFHGNLDEVIYYNSSIKLKPFLKNTDTLITLDGQGHNGMTDNLEYSKYIEILLSK